MRGAKIAPRLAPRIHNPSVANGAAMNPFLKIKQFASREDGSLLVFFLISVVTILGIVALSFDLGRRASTQTDMQSFADNVALAAAGELDGQPDAIARATYAANNAIAAANEALKGGVAGTNATLSIETLVFYSDLPATDRPGSFDVADLSDLRQGFRGRKRL